jgi:hypothetical protein
VSTKKLMRARVSAASGEPEAGKRCEGYASARKVATMPDSVMIEPLKLIVGTRPRWRGHVSLGMWIGWGAIAYRINIQIPWVPRLV